MKNLVILIMSVGVVFFTLLLPQNLRFRDNLDSVNCGAPVSYLKIDLSNDQSIKFPKNIYCVKSVFDSQKTSIDWFALIFSIIFVYLFLQIVLIIRNSKTTIYTKYPASPIKNSTGNIRK